MNTSLSKTLTQCTPLTSYIRFSDIMKNVHRSKRPSVKRALDLTTSTASRLLNSLC